MVPRKQNKRLLAVATFGTLAVLGAVLLFSALKDNTQFFYNPSEVAAASFVPKSDHFRIGGLVTPGSVQKDHEVTTRFLVQDFDMSDNAADNMVRIPVTYSGVLPDMFEEGTGVVVEGRLGEGGEFYADDVLAKHDENYQPVKPKT